MRQSDSGPEQIYWNWESGIRDHEGDVDMIRMFQNLIYFPTFAFACGLHIQLKETFASRNVEIIKAAGQSESVSVQLLGVLKAPRIS